MAQKSRVREEMTRSFVQALKEDKLPWEQGWTSREAPVNAVSGATYRGVNKMWLSYVADQKGYTDPRWCTFKKAASQGWKIRGGERGTHIEFWSMYDAKTKKKLSLQEAKELSQSLSEEEYLERVKPIVDNYSVFNAEQIEGIPERTVVREPFEGSEFIAKRDTLFQNMGVNFREGGGEAVYRLAEDLILLPVIGDFRDAYSYMSTVLHEAGHATGHETRLNRELKNQFGSAAYAKEELRAEIASAFTAQTLLIGNNTSDREYVMNHKAYVQSWIKVLENNPNELFAAIKDAEKISDYLIEKGQFDRSSKAMERISEASVEAAQKLEPKRLSVESTKKSDIFSSKEKAGFDLRQKIFGHDSRDVVKGQQKVKMQLRLGK